MIMAMKFCITFDDGLLAQGRVAAPLLEKYGWRGMFTVPTGILSAQKLTPRQAEDLCLVGNEDKLMTWDDVRGLLARGHIVCPHTRTHADMRELLSAGRMDDAEREVADAKREFAERTGVVSKWFCLPHSSNSPEIDALVRKHGMEPINGGASWRPNVGEHADGYESFSDIRSLIRHLYYLGMPSLDVVIHGVVRAEGGYRPFEDAAAFERFLQDVQAEVELGRIRVCRYDEVHVPLLRCRALRLKMRSYVTRGRAFLFKLYRQLRHIEVEDPR